jgi:hypothetical protein
VRFASPTFLGDDLEVRLYDLSDLSDVSDAAAGAEAGRRVHPFEAEAGGAAVVRNGRADVRP